MATDFPARIVELNAYIRFHSGSDAIEARVEREGLLDSKAEAILALVEAAAGKHHAKDDAGMPFVTDAKSYFCIGDCPGCAVEALND